MSAQQIATHAPLVYTPEFWDPAKSYTNYVPDLEGAKIAGRAYAVKHGLDNSAKLLARPEGASMLFLTDLENDFRDNGRLPVKGTDDVVLRTCVRALNGFVAGYFAHVMVSIDGHPGQHISFGSFFRNTKGELFDLRVRKAAILNLVDDNKAIFQATCFNPADGSPVDAGYVQPLFGAKKVVEYNRHLVATGQTQWAFAEHCMLGTDGTALHPLLAETLAFISGMRQCIFGQVFKGHLVFTDWFGPLEPCHPDPSHPQGGFQSDVVEQMKQYRTVEFAGVAEDFCDYWMKEQTMRKLMSTPQGAVHAGKLRFIEDGTAPIVPNQEHVRLQNEKARGLGVKFVRHDTAFAESL